LKTSKRGKSSSKPALVAMVGRLEPRTADAFLSFLEVLLDLDIDRQRAIRLVEAMSVLLAQAPRRAAGRRS
jgi:hypothetical protein